MDNAITTTITWIIEWMSVSTKTIDGYTEVVLSAGWRVTATNGTYSASNYGSSSFTQPDSRSSFTPYADLTEEQVLGWCWTNGVNKEDQEANVATQIETQVNPPVTTPPLPWVTPVVV